MKIKIKFGLRIFLSLLILLTQSGCTCMLWNNDDLEAYKEPAQNPNLKLFESIKRNDFLVVYNEYSERHDVVHTRTYWLNKNENRVEKHHTPFFASKKSIDDLPSIPVYCSAPNKSNEGIYAVCETNQQSFTLFSEERELGSYNLPVYNDHWGLVEKTALTPFAVTTDVAIAGAYVGLLMWSQTSGYTISVK